MKKAFYITSIIFVLGVILAGLQFEQVTGVIGDLSFKIFFPLMLVGMLIGPLGFLFFGISLVVVILLLIKKYKVNSKGILRDFGLVLYMGVTVLAVSVGIYALLVETPYEEIEKTYGSYENYTQAMMEIFEEKNKHIEILEVKKHEFKKEQGVGFGSEDYFVITYELYIKAQSANGEYYVGDLNMGIECYLDESVDECYMEYANFGNLMDEKNQIVEDAVIGVNGKGVFVW